ncbi:protein ECT2 isoform X1 [Frankliniella occidentalis]|uniref:Protein ECT2 isoform X1 n=1 Tax=Frankliniella occidentalis TaxID=133901 RepID=A0A6J1SW98_FRAOC|nr:protein ECT2 isoform X1 [Frankliniella occidentalis]
MEEEDGGGSRLELAGTCQQICVVGSLALDPLVMSAVQALGLPVSLSATGSELIDLVENTIFIVDDMEGPLFEAPHNPRFRVLGRTALLELTDRGENLPSTTRPLFSTSMSGLVVCFTGFRKKDHLMKLVKLVQSMGGSIRKEMSVSVTHLIAQGCGGKKYHYATTFRVPVMSEDWVFAAWQRRKEVGFGAAASDFTANFKLKPFQGAKVCFVGFPEEEKKHMEEVLVENGGTVADMSDCSHVVVESYKAYSLLKGKTAPVPVGENKSQHSKCSDLPHPIPPQRRRSSFLHLLLSPNKYPAIREEDGSSSPRTPESKSPSTSSYETPKLSFVPSKTPKVPYFPSISELPTSTPKFVDDHHDSSHDEMVTAEDWDLVSDPMDQTSPPTTPPGTTQTFEKPSPTCIHPDCVAQVIDDPMMCDQEDTTSAPVVDNVQAQASTFGLMSSHIVKPEWFWISVQNEGAADETEYKFEGCLEGVMSPATSRDSLGTPTSSRLRKRKRIRDGVSRQIPDSPSIHKRRSSISDAGLLSLSSSFLDCSTVSEKLSTDEVEAATLKSLSNLSPRQQVFHELVQTETNYVGILRTIMTLIKKPLEEFSEGEGPLLDNTELKTIFGHLPPIYDLHAAMLQELIRANANWTETTSIGSIILRHSRDMVKAYPPFVNFFEQTKEMLHKCDETKPRFHAFLKVCQSKPECGRQTLGELLIRPVQRLPSISLLLGDILKHTRKDNPDHAALDEALHAVREVMTHINEDKRRMEACMDMFSIFNDIENCPPHLVSSHRAFVTRCDVIELSNELSGRGDALVFFLFSDILEICKKRSKGTSLKSPNTATLRSCKHFKHVRLIPLSDIKRVFDVEREGNNEENIFALKCRSNQELKEKLYSFSLSDEDIDKNNFLQTLCRQLANTVCKADAAYFLSPIDYNELDISANDAAFGTLSKAFKLASRTKMKIGRTFSFNSKTPSKLKRAVSSMMSPFGSTTNLTPASQLAQMRLASCTNLNELASSPSEPEALKPPMSVQPRRKRPV